MPNREVTVLGQRIAKGKGAQLNLDIAKLHTRTRIQVPIIVERGKKEGPVLLITAGIHGNEINGIEIVRQFVSKGFHKPEAGMVICIPRVNVFGFLNQERYFPDGRDLNRVFPGSPRGSLTSRYAYHIIKEIAPLVDYCIDFHTGGDSRFNIPQIRITEGDDESLKLAKVFDPPFIIANKNKDKSFRHTLFKLKKTVLLFEGGKSLNINDKVTRSGLFGALKVLHHLNMRDFSEELTSIKSGKEGHKIVTDSAWLRAKYSGMFHPMVKLGKRVYKGEVIGSVSDPFGYFERNVKASFTGYVICTNESPIVNQGDALFHISKD
ncbi:succinylglutamate desuccinylase/aspartoacylase family protein [Flavobacteriaceae bacterium M23B6Z8]